VISQCIRVKPSGHTNIIVKYAKSSPYSRANEFLRTMCPSPLPYLLLYLQRPVLSEVRLYVHHDVYNRAVWNADTV